MAKTRSVTSKARGGRSTNTPTIAAVVVLIILAVVVFGGIYWSSSNKPDPAAAPIPLAPVQASYTTALQGNVIVAGSGPKVLDLYEDVQCPACKKFEELFGDKITGALNANRVTVRYHMVNLLEQSTTPPGYSTLGGSALMCAAENSPNGSAFPTLFNTLFVQQPSEGGSGFAAQQLVDAGQAAGAGGAYAGCVQNRTHGPAVAANFEAAQNDKALQQSSGGSSGFATPTVVLNGKTVTPDDPALVAALR